MLYAMLMLRSFKTFHVHAGDLFLGVYHSVYNAGTTAGTATVGFAPSVHV
jgi:hypothetical protein